MALPLARRRSGGSSSATGSPSKKSLHAAEQGRPDVAAARRRFIVRQPALDPKHLIFLDETAATTKMTRTHGRCLRGQRLLDPVPHGHWKTSTLVAGLRETIEAHAATLLYLPPYSPDFNPIEKAFAKIKATLRKIGARTRKALWQAIAEAIEDFSRTECLNLFQSA